MVFGCAGIFVLTVVFLGPKVKTEFFPRSDDGRLSVDINLPVGTAQAVTAEMAASI